MPLVPDINCDLTVLPDGNLKISLADNASGAALIEALQTLSHDSIWSRILEPWEEHGSFYNATGYVGLTDSPAISSDLDFSDQAPFVPDEATLWWFPNYQIHSELEELAKQGYTIATKA